MKNGIIGILPALLNQTLGGAARIFDKPIAIHIAVPINPLKSPQDVRPDLSDERQISRATIIRSGQHHKQRRGVNTPVVATKRHLLESRHLPLPDLMKDFSRFSV